MYSVLIFTLPAMLFGSQANCWVASDCNKVRRVPKQYILIMIKNKQLIKNYMDND